MVTMSGSSGGAAPKSTKKTLYRPAGTTPSDLALSAFQDRNTANEKKVGAWGTPGAAISAALNADNAMRSGLAGNLGQLVMHGQGGHFNDPMEAAKKALAQYKVPSSDITPASSVSGGHSQMDAARLQAVGNVSYADPAPTGSGDIGFELPAAPTMNLPKMDYNGYLQQALGGLNLGALDKSYQDNIDLIGSDTRTAVGNIGQAAQGAQADIRGGTGLLQQTGQANNANGAALEAALSAQQQATAQGSGAANSSLAHTLGTGTAVGGNANSSLAAQNAAAQQYLAAAAQNNQAANNATTQAQVADNQNYGRVVDAKATSDSQNAQMAGRDAQSQVGLQRSQADLQARESASAQAAGMQQNGLANALAQFQAEAGLYGTKSQNAFSLAGLGLQEKQFEAGQTAAQAQALQQYLTDREGALEKILQFGGTNPEVSGQMVQDVGNYGDLNPYLAALGGGGALPLNVNTAKKYHLGGY